MADGDQTLKLELTLSEQAVRHLRKRADELGWTLEAAAAFVLEQQFFSYDDYTWSNGDPRTKPPPSFDPDEPTYSHEEVMAGFREQLERRLAARR